jgi:alkylmercury lyase
MTIHGCCSAKPAENEINLDDVAARTAGAFPALNLLEQRLSLQLYRALAEGEPVPRGTLAQRLGSSVEAVNGVLDRWPGVFSDSRRRIVGYWGLAIPAAYASPHQFTVCGRKLSAWCAWDTLFLPQLLGETAEIESASPDGRTTIRLTVSPDGVERVDPVGAGMSFLLPNAAAVHKDVVNSFCHFIHFFPSHSAGEAWIAQRADIFMLSIGDAHVLARRRNEIQYGEVLQ